MAKYSTPPKEIREKTAERRAWIRDEVDRLVKAGMQNVRAVRSGSYQTVMYSEPKPEPKETWSGLCQVCGRRQGSVNGLGEKVAHHGYERPELGWQTSSCSGALWPFLQDSCTRAVEIRERYVERRETCKRVLKVVPVNLVYTVRVRGAAGSFRYNDEVRTIDPSGDPKIWASVLANHYRQIEGEIKSLTWMIEDLDQRIADWRTGTFAETTRLA